MLGNFCVDDDCVSRVPGVSGKDDVSLIALEGVIN